MKYSYMDNIGTETLSKEYKLFTFYPKGINIDPNDKNDCEKLLKEGKWIFNNCVFENLKYYIESYLPKYSSAYLNSNSKTNDGELFIGVSDDGFIHGIPFKGDLSSVENLEYIDSIFRNVIDSNDLQSKSNLYKYIKWEVININKNNVLSSSKDLFFDFQQKINLYNKEKERYQVEKNKFFNHRKTWYELIIKYNDKLHNMLNDSKKRVEIIKYIERNIRDKDFKYREDVKKIISKLKNYNPKLPFKHIKNDEVKKLKKNYNNIWYWVTKWKDYNIDFLKEIKPLPPQPIPGFLLPVSIITTIVDMIPFWIIKNSINIYLIKITFIKPNHNIKIKYKFEDDYFESRRDEINSIPCCNRLF